MKKLLSIALLIAVVASMAIVANAGSNGQKYENGDVQFVAPGSIVVDGKIDEAYKTSAKIIVDSISPDSDKDNLKGTTGTVYVLWDGTYIYLCADVKDNTHEATSMMQYVANDGWDVDCTEFFICWNNSDVPTVKKWHQSSLIEAAQFRVVPTNVDPSLGGAYCNCYEEVSGFGNSEDLPFEFLDEGAMITEGGYTMTASGYIGELKIKLPAQDKLGAVDFTYGEGSKLGLFVQIFDGIQFDQVMMLSDPNGLSSVERAANDGVEGVMESAWEPANWWYVELKGGSSAPADTTEAPADTTEAPADTTEAPADTTEAPADTTKAPETTKAPVADAPQTSDVAVAGIAVLATLALAGVVVAKKVR